MCKYALARAWSELGAGMGVYQRGAIACHGERGFGETCLNSSEIDRNLAITSCHNCLISVLDPGAICRQICLLTSS